MLLYEMKLLFKTMWGRLMASLLVVVLLYAAISSVTVKPPSFNDVVIGIVNEDDSFYIDMLISNANDLGMFDGLFSIEVLSREEADRLISENRLSAYVVVPEGFIDDLNYGEMPQLLIVCNLKRPLETRAIMLVAQSGAALIQIGQAGVYATIDFAAEHGLGADDFTGKVVVPINMAFISVLMNFEALYRSVNLAPEHGLDIDILLVRAAACFCMFLSLILFFPIYRSWFKKPLLNMYKANKISLPPLILYKQAALLIMLTAAFLPMLYIYGPLYFALIFCLSGILLFCSVFFADTTKAAGILFIMLYALIDFFIAGGLLPFSSMPSGLSFLRSISIHYHAVFVEHGSASWLIVICIGLLFIAASSVKIYKRG